MTQLVTTIENHTFEVEVEHIDPHAEVLTVRVNGRPLQVRVPDWKEAFEEVEWMVVENRPYEIMFDPDLHWLKAYRGIHQVEVHNGNTTVSRPRSEDGRIKAPIPGLITRVLVNQGDAVEAGQAVLVLEAMKMENEIRAIGNGVVNALHVSPGQVVARHAVLVEII